MSEQVAPNYWLFQSNPTIFQLKAALRAGLFFSFPVKQHRKKIKSGDRVILWQTGRLAGIYALGTVVSEVGEGAIPLEEAIFFQTMPENLPRVYLRIDYNLWNKPITKELLPHSKSFDRFYAGLPGTNYKASEQQYTEIVSLIEQYDLVNEPVEEYVVQKSAHFPLNLILHGPPGTGKTYLSINYALAIIENRSLEELSYENRADLRARFEEYQQAGLIHFVTFHQSMTYEDFVEGIKPQLENGQVNYGIEQGIFKQICLEAKRDLVESLMNQMPKQELRIDYNQLYKAFLAYLKGKDFNTFVTLKGSKILLHKIARFGNISVRPQNSFTVYTLSKNSLRKMYQTFPTFEGMAPNKIYDAIRDVVGGVNAQAYFAVFNELKKFEGQYVQQLLQAKEELEMNDETVQEFDLNSIAYAAQLNARKHILIIDEINRGNIAAIFGELITLIEPDKREGQEEALSTILPYSKEWFAVPPNLHLICTMNTADRSVDTMDLALRRRFTFVEVGPRAGILKEEGRRPAEVGVDLEKLLNAMNRRIKALLDREHCLGHAFLMHVYTLDDLREAFATKIIPLLQEYFYNDFSKIGLILGNDFFRMKGASSKDIFADFDHEIAQEWEEHSLLELRPMEEIKEDAFIRIYDKEWGR